MCRMIVVQQFSNSNKTKIFWYEKNCMADALI